MFLKRFYDDKLAQASYLLACGGEAVVLDPNRDADQYLRAAAAEGVTVAAVTETHIHADYASGSRELAHAAGARLYVSGEGGPDWSYAFADEPGVVVLRDGATFEVGAARLQAMHTPGHTPEHMSFLVTDTSATDQPMGLFSGDFVFVGDVGRPDLLERAVGVTGAAEGAARSLWRSLRRLDGLPDFLQIWPSHGAGSACGKGLGGVPQSTLGYERLGNWAFSCRSEDEFVRRVLEGQPTPPRYFARMKRLNREGAPLLDGLRRPPRLGAGGLPEVLATGRLVVDLRPAAQFAAKRVRGTFSIPLGRTFTTWAGWLLPYDDDFYLLGDDDVMAEAARDLALIGLDHPTGYFGPEAVEQWGGPSAVGSVGPRELEEIRGTVSVVDVRNPAEWQTAHIPGAVNVPLGDLRERAEEVSRERPVVVYCQSGFRSGIGTSILESMGRSDVLDLRGGFQAWRAEVG